MHRSENKKLRWNNSSLQKEPEFYTMAENKIFGLIVGEHTNGTNNRLILVYIYLKYLWYNLIYFYEDLNILFLSISFEYSNFKSVVPLIQFSDIYHQWHLWCRNTDWQLTKTMQYVRQLVKKGAVNMPRNQDRLVLS